MKIIAIIPARYASTRFPGKPLVDICGKPMIWWVYNRVSSVEEFDDVVVATDDERIEKVCKEYDMKVIMTHNNHPNHISRIQEVSDKIQSDYYICVNGDEPLIDPISVKRILPKEKNNDEIVFVGARRKLTNPAETIDSANIKMVIGENNLCMYMSRTPIPYPKGTLFFDYWKYVGIECFNKKALDFFVNTKMGNIEKVEDIDHIRFLENGIKIYFKEVESESLSVDTPKDLEKVIKIIEEKNE